MSLSVAVTVSHAQKKRHSKKVSSTAAAAASHLFPPLPSPFPLSISLYRRLQRHEHR